MSTMSNQREITFKRCVSSVLRCDVVGEYTTSAQNTNNELEIKRDTQKQPKRQKLLCKQSNLLLVKVKVNYLCGLGRCDSS